MLSAQKFSIAIFFVMHSIGGFSQDEDLRQKYSDSVSMYYGKGNYCGNQTKLELKNIVKTSPFDSTIDIKLISFKTHPVVNNKFDLDRAFKVFPLKVISKINS